MSPPLASRTPTAARATAAAGPVAISTFPDGTRSPEDSRALASASASTAVGAPAKIAHADAKPVSWVLVYPARTVLTTTRQILALSNGLAILPIPWLLESIAPINVGAKLKSWVLAFHATAAPMNKAIEVSLSTRTMAFLPMEVKIALHALVRLVLWDGAFPATNATMMIRMICGVLSTLGSPFPIPASAPEILPWVLRGCLVLAVVKIA